MSIGILALQGDFQAHALALNRLGIESRLVRKPAELATISGLILPGGESSTMLNFLEEAGFWDELSAAVRRVPVFGTCAGAILLAREVTHPQQRALGVLDLTVERNAYGRQVDSSIRESEVAPDFRAQLGDTLETVLIRAPRFLHPGPGVAILATNAGQPVLVRQANILAATFHPELTKESRVHAYFANMATESREASRANRGKEPATRRMLLDC